ncbi:hypothetical protein Tco_1097526 [Tanacetum coccineum]
MSIFKVPKSVLNYMESLRRNFFNGFQEGDRKIAWVKWSKVLASKKFRGLGVSSFFALNRALLFKWGEHMRRELYGAIRNVNLNHQQGHHKALEMNPIFVLTYSLSRFLLSFKAKKPNCDLYPNKCEAQSEWFKRSTDFFKMYTPRAPPVEYGGLFGAYLKKLSLARTRREKDGDAESGCQTSTKEVSLKDRVKAMEGLCTSLMILPKEIKSLKARVYKLETIINVSFFILHFFPPCIHIRHVV